MVDVLTRIAASAATVERRPPLRIYFGFAVALLAVVAIVVLRDIAQRNHDAAQHYTNEIWDAHDRSQAQRLIDKLIDHQVYNQRQTSLAESFPLTMRIVANPALGIVTACRPPNRLQFKARVTAPTFEVANSLDDIVSLADGVQRFSWMLTPHQAGVEDVRIRGIVYCLSPQSVVTMRQTAVDELRAVEVAQPFVLTPDNWTNLGIALAGFIGSSGALAFLGSLFRHGDAKH